MGEECPVHFPQFGHFFLFFIIHFDDLELLHPSPVENNSRATGLSLHLYCKEELSLFYRESLRLSSRVALRLYSVEKHCVCPVEKNCVSYWERTKCSEDRSKPNCQKISLVIQHDVLSNIVLKSRRTKRSLSLKKILLSNQTLQSDNRTLYNLLRLQDFTFRLLCHNFIAHFLLRREFAGVHGHNSRRIFRVAT